MSEERPAVYDQFVRERLAAGDNPNDMMWWLEQAIPAVSDYHDWGNGRWTLDTVCAICGSSLAGVCGHRAFDIPVVLRREFVPGKHGDPNIVKCCGCGREAHKDAMPLSFIGGRCESCEAQRPYVPLEREPDRDA